MRAEPELRHGTEQTSVRDSNGVERGRASVHTSSSDRQVKTSYKGGQATASSRRQALVAYGSETGNALDAAEEVERLLRRLRFSTDLLSLDAIEPAMLNSFDVCCILISTTGQGDLPDGSKLFWRKLLRKRLRGDFLHETQYALYGLGDSSYPKFNWATLKIGKRLQQLGAHAVIAKGEGDDQHPDGYNATFPPWCQSLYEALCAEFPLPLELQPIPDHVSLPPKWPLAEIKGSELDSFSVGEPTLTRATEGNFIDVVLEENRRLTPVDHWQDVRLVRFKVQSTHAYVPGDTLTIYPQNPAEDVDAFMEMMGWTGIADTPLEVPNRASTTSQFAGSLQTTTVRRLLTQEVDLNAIPRRSFFAKMVPFCNDEFQRERLIELTNSPKDELDDYTTRPRRSIIEVLQEFDGVKLPWQRIVDDLPGLRGRKYSIASGGALKHGTSVHDAGSRSTCFELLVAVVKYRTVIRKLRRGTCTRYLAGLEPGTSLRVLLQRGGLGADGLFRPLVLVGPGTGIAPIRSLIHERRLEQRRLRSEFEKKGAIVDGGSAQAQLANGWTEVTGNGSTTLASPVAAPAVLFYGCRNENADFFFRDEWEEAQDDIPLAVFAAFSRDQDGKVYVQDLIREQAALVHRLLCRERGIVYVCGSSGSMPRAVREALADAFEAQGSMGREDAVALLTAMEKEGRYKQETW